MTVNDEITPTWKHALIVWWAWAWRAFIFSLLAGFAAGFVVGLVGVIFKIEAETVASISGIAGGIAGAFIGIWMLLIVLKKRYKRFRIALLPVDELDKSQA